MTLPNKATRINYQPSEGELDSMGKLGFIYSLADETWNRDHGPTNLCPLGFSLHVMAFTDGAGDLAHWMGSYTLDGLGGDFVCVDVDGRFSTAWGAARFTMQEFKKTFEKLLFDL